jgi:hypothetical protein
MLDRDVDRRITIEEVRNDPWLEEEEEEEDDDDEEC